MTSKMNMIVKAITLKVTGIGKAHAMLEKYLLAAEQKLLAPFSFDPATWDKTDVLFLVACAGSQDTWTEFQKGIEFARQHLGLSDIDANLDKGVFTPNFESEFRMIRKALLALL